MENNYTYVWYKEIKTKEGTYFTKPFRTTVKAKNKEEAKEKVIDFAMGKMKLIVMEEAEYNKSKLPKMNNILDECFDKIKNIMDNLFLDTKTK